MTWRGHPRCADCRGAGVVQTPDGYRVCTCVRGTPAARAAQRRANASGAREPAGDAVRRAVDAADERRR